jgi:hypothetical protein
MSFLRLAAPVLLASFAFATTGCVVHTRPAVVTTTGGVEYVYAEPGVVVENHPYVIYDGAPVYYVEGRWYRRTAHGWAYYHRPPAVLVRSRVVHRR